MLRKVTWYPRGVFSTKRSALKRWRSHSVRLHGPCENVPLNLRWSTSSRYSKAGESCARHIPSKRVYVRLINVFGNPSRTRKGFQGCCPTRWRPVVRVAWSFSIANETPSAAKPACGTRVVLESWTTWVRRAGYWRHGRQELLTAKFFLNSLCGGRQVLPQRVHDHPASSVHACSAGVPLDGGCSFLVHTTDRPCERGLVKE